MSQPVRAQHPGLLYVLPTFPGRVAVIEAAWLAAGELSSAVGARLGGAEVLSPSGLLSPEQVMGLSVRGTTQPNTTRLMVRALPPLARTVLAEVRAWDRARRMRNLARLTTGRPYRLVIQLHRRHHDCGLVVARSAKVPFVLRVEALEVREEEAWGVHRPVWGKFAERWGEIRIIKQADLVVVVSEVLDAQLAEAGVEGNRRIVVPNGVDLDLFSPGERDADLLPTYGLEGRFLVGWVGGFRPFHGLEAIPAIANRLRAEVPEAVLCLVGTGPERDSIARRTRGMEDVVRFIGPVAHDDVPRWIRSFDACLLLASSSDFHYSPLKLYEYMGCGRPMVAADVGEVSTVIRDGQDGLLVPPDDPGAVVSAIARLAEDRGLRERLGAEARRTAVRCGSWDARAEALLNAVESRGLFDRHAPRQSSRG